MTSKIQTDERRKEQRWKANDGVIRYRGFMGDERRMTSAGRRQDDLKCWQNLPTARETLHVKHSQLNGASWLNAADPN